MSHFGTRAAGGSLRIGWKQTDAAAIVDPSRSGTDGLAFGQPWPAHWGRRELDTGRRTDHPQLG